MGSVFITLLRSMIKELAGPLGIFMYCDGQKEKHPDTDNKWFLNFNQKAHDSFDMVSIRQFCGPLLQCNLKLHLREK